MENYMPSNDAALRKLSLVALTIAELIRAARPTESHVFAAMRAAHRDEARRIAVNSAKLLECRAAIVVSPFMAVCHEYRRSIRRYATVREMKEDPSRSAIRC